MASLATQAIPMTGAARPALRVALPSCRDPFAARNCACARTSLPGLSRRRLLVRTEARPRAIRLQRDQHVTSPTGAPSRMEPSTPMDATAASAEVAARARPACVPTATADMSTRRQPPLATATPIAGPPWRRAPSLSALSIRAAASHKGTAWEARFACFPDCSRVTADVTARPSQSAAATKAIRIGPIRTWARVHSPTTATPSSPRVLGQERGDCLTFTTARPGPTRPRWPSRPTWEDRLRTRLG